MNIIFYKCIYLEYDLFNSTNEKIGTTKYFQDFNAEKEWFEVYDLDGNKV